MKIRPLQDRIVVRRAEAEKTSKGGIIIPDSGQEQSLEGEVLAVGPGVWLDNGERRPIAVEVGQVVLFSNKYAGTEVEIEGEKYHILREEDVAGVVESP